MFKWFKSLFKKEKKKEPEVAVKAQPVELNPSPSVREERRAARMARLQAAILAGDTRKELVDEIYRLKRGK